MTVVCVLVACLFPRVGYDSVLATASGPPGLTFKPGAGTPAGPALSQARKLLGEQAMKRIVELDASVADADLGIGLLGKGLEVTAIDVTTMDHRRRRRLLHQHHAADPGPLQPMQSSLTLKLIARVTARR